MGEFLLEQNSLFDLSLAEVLQRMQHYRDDIWQEDYQFLQLQRLTPQVGSIHRVTFTREKKEKTCTAVSTKEEK